MRLDKENDYALRVLMHLAADADRLSAIDAIAARYRTSKAHVAHVVRLLGRAGFVETARGRLAPGGASIRVGDVVREMENDLGAVERLRPDGGHCLVARQRRLKPVLDAATAAFLVALDGRGPRGGKRPAEAGACVTQGCVGIGG